MFREQHEQNEEEEETSEQFSQAFLQLSTNNDEPDPEKLKLILGGRKFFFILIFLSFLNNLKKNVRSLHPSGP